jgi:hypothetical protein
VSRASRPRVPRASPYGTPQVLPSIGFDWLCFGALETGAYPPNPFSHRDLCLLVIWQIGFVFSTAFPQYASRSTQYEIDTK